jgi:putative endonuclease
MQYTVYIIRCQDASLYSGITTDLARRIHEHNHTARGARYTRSRRPVEVVYTEQYPSRSLALQREAALKQLSRDQKLALITHA